MSDIHYNNIMNMNNWFTLEISKQIFNNEKLYYDWIQNKPKYTMFIMELSDLDLDKITHWVSKMEN